MGPVTSTLLRQLAVGGDLSPKDLVWREGISDWKPAGLVKGLEFKKAHSELADSDGDGPADLVAVAANTGQLRS